MEENFDDYLKECEDRDDAIRYLVMDANVECSCDLSEETLKEIAKRII